MERHITLHSEQSQTQTSPPSSAPDIDHSCHVSLQFVHNWGRSFFHNVWDTHQPTNQPYPTQWQCHFKSAFVNITLKSEILSMPEHILDEIRNTSSWPFYTKLVQCPHTSIAESFFLVFVLHSDKTIFSHIHGNDDMMKNMYHNCLSCWQKLWGQYLCLQTELKFVLEARKGRSEQDTEFQSNSDKTVSQVKMTTNTNGATCSYNCLPMDIILVNTEGQQKTE